MARYIVAICLALLIGIGLQILCVEGIAESKLDLSRFTIWQWLLEVVYLVFLVSLAIHWSNDED